MERVTRTHQIYAENLKGIDMIEVLPFNTHEGELPLWTDALVENRDMLVEYLNDKNIYCRKFWHPLHTQKPYLSSDQEFPVSTQLGPKAVWLPSAFTMVEEDILYICSTIRSFYD
jgi:perosamine synthetase